MAVRLLATVTNWGPLYVTARPGARQTLKRDSAAPVATDGEFFITTRPAQDFFLDQDAIAFTTYVTGSRALKELNE